MKENEATTIEYAHTLISRNRRERRGAFVRADGAKMLLCARAVLSDRSAAEDAVQESFIKIVRNIRSYRKGSNAAAWVLTITRNAAVTELRKAKGVRRLFRRKSGSRAVSRKRGKFRNR